MDGNLSLTAHEVELGMDFAGVKGLLGTGYDWNFTKAHVYMGSSMVLITNKKASFATFGQLGEEVGEVPGVVCLRG